MPRRISDELRKKIIEMMEAGLNISQIARTLKLPYSTVYNQIPEVRERAREYIREYCERPEVKERRQLYRWSKRYGELLTEMMYELNDFINLTPKARSTIFTRILEVLDQFESGLEYAKILELISEYYPELYPKLRRKSPSRSIKSIRWELNRLIDIGLISYKNGRYVINNEGREFLKKLYETQILNY